MARTKAEIKAEVEKIKYVMADNMLSNMLSFLTEPVPDPEQDPEAAALYAIKRVEKLGDDLTLYKNAAMALSKLADEALGEA